MTAIFTGRAEMPCAKFPDIVWNIWGDDMQVNFQSNIGTRSRRSFPLSPSLVLSLIAALLLLIAFIFHFVSGSVAREADLLATEGVDVVATVIDSRVQETVTRERDSDGFTHNETKVSYYLTLAFDTADGKSVEVEKSVSGPIFNLYAKGDTLPFRYAASDPTVTEFEKGSRAGDATAFKWISRGLGAVGLILIGVAVYLRRKPAAQL